MVEELKYGKIIGSLTWPYKAQTRGEEKNLKWVSELIDPELKQWKECSLRSHFNQEESKKIKAIPINLGGREDRQVWASTQNGLFIVKSA